MEGNSSERPTPRSPAGRRPRRSAILRGILFGLLTLVVYVAATALLNRFYAPPPVERATIHPAASGPLAAARLRLVSWNIGYAGMGRESDFVADGGTQSRPLSADLVRRNLERIRQQIADLDADVYLLQEVARPSSVTYQTDTLRPLRRTLPGYDWTFGADLKTRWLPRPLRVVIGNATFSRFSLSAAERRALPLEPQFIAGVFRKGYRIHVARLPAAGGGNEWVLVNVHLAAFDDEAAVRRRQLDAVLGFAADEYDEGNYVVLGGDWNLRLAPTEFPSRTEERHLFWIHDLPSGLVAPGWSWGIDPEVPTVRTAHQPYVAGDNYVTIIDGFLCSPNVEIEEIRGLDLGFENTDHHPVTIRVAARD